MNLLVKIYLTVILITTLLWLGSLVFETVTDAGIFSRAARITGSFGILLLVEITITVVGGALCPAIF